MLRRDGVDRTADVGGVSVGGGVGVGGPRGGVGVVGAVGDARRRHGGARRGHPALKLDKCFSKVHHDQTKSSSSSKSLSSDFSSS